jgi:rubrerythrin
MPGNSNVIKIFEYALNQERTGLNFFRQALKTMGIGAAVTALQRLTLEEEGHIAFISSILKDLRRDGEIDLDSVKELAIEPTDYFDARARTEFLEQCVQGSMIPDVTVFSTAWLIEKDLSDFYSKMAEKVEGAPKSALEMLSKWEAEHERFFREYRDRLSATYAEMPWGG